MSRRLHPNDKRTLEWMRRRQADNGKPVSVQSLAMYRDWTVSGARNFVGRMQRRGLVDGDGKVLL